jgi:hypothetical protein
MSRDVRPTSIVLECERAVDRTVPEQSMDHVRDLGLRFEGRAKQHGDDPI